MCVGTDEDGERVNGELRMANYEFADV